MAVSRVAGVRDASFSYPEGVGAVTFDTTVTTPEVFLRELESATGFAARVVGHR